MMGDDWTEIENEIYLSVNDFCHSAWCFGARCFVYAVLEVEMHALPTKQTVVTRCAKSEGFRVVVERPRCSANW